jgi:prepilin-type N-terminal cleavage/methylation domain-containing protein
VHRISVMNVEQSSKTRGNMKSTISRRHGFTIIEVGAVVAILSLLGAITIPNAVKANGPSHRAACISNLRQIDSAMQVCASERKLEALAPVTYSDIAPYLKGKVVCPAGGTTFEDSYMLSTVVVPPACRVAPLSHMLPQ